ncbi:TetR/AcrR family transcriptional regulator [Paenibacillus sp. P26]|nr:TetR/AcrR family transcriptional regulator [Paenibacillus sp. P26]
MPLPFSRFEKLAREKRELLLDQAAREFAAHGFEQSSINRILEQSNMSKGAPTIILKIRQTYLLR